jgi:FAD:protein FMN transferase
MSIRLFKSSFKAMGSRCEVQLYTTQQQWRFLQQAAIAEVRRLESKYTRYQPSSITSQINSSAGATHPVCVDEETARLLDYALVLHEQSDGLFDVTSGVLRRAWNFKSNSLPKKDQLAECIALIGWERVEWLEPNIRLPLLGMEIDLGGFVKEYAADSVADICVELGVSGGLVNLGGDIHVIGPHPDGSPWQVGIQHPRAPNKPIAQVAISKGAIATSGDYERFMIVDGVRYSHLLNPMTGQSIQPRYASASVIAPRCLLAGSFSTLALLKSELEPDWLADQGLPYLTVDLELNLKGSLANA